MLSNLLTSRTYYAVLCLGEGGGRPYTEAMAEIIHRATQLTSAVDVRGGVSRLSYEPSFPKNGSQFDRVLWLAGELQNTLGVTVELLEVEGGYNVRLWASNTDWQKFCGPFSLDQLPSYLRGLGEGYQYAVRPHPV